MGKRKTKKTGNGKGRQSATKAKPVKIEEAERQGLLQKLIGTLKRVIGYKKGERNEFRYNYDTKHPNYIFKEENGKYKSFGLTHEDKTFGRKNMPLSENTNKNDKEPSYIRNGIVDSKKSRNSGKLKGHTLPQKDVANVKSKKRYHKKEAKQKNKKKTSK